MSPFACKPANGAARIQAVLPPSVPFGCSQHVDVVCGNTSTTDSFQCVLYGLLNGEVVCAQPAVLAPGHHLPIRVVLPELDSGVLMFYLCASYGSLCSATCAAPLLVLPKEANAEARHLLTAMIDEAFPKERGQESAGALESWEGSDWRELSQEARFRCSWAWESHFQPLANDFAVLLEVNLRSVILEENWKRIGRAAVLKYLSLNQLPNLARFLDTRMVENSPPCELTYPQATPAEEKLVLSPLCVDQEAQGGGRNIDFLIAFLDGGARAVPVQEEVDLLQTSSIYSPVAGLMRGNPSSPQGHGWLTLLNLLLVLAVSFQLLMSVTCPVTTLH